MCQVLRYQAKLATLELWSGAVSHLQRKLMRELTLLRVEEEVSEPMQRLAEIRSIFESLGSNGCEALLATAQLVFVAPFLVRSLGTWSFLFLGHLLLQRSELREDLQFQAWMEPKSWNLTGSWSLLAIMFGLQSTKV